MTDRQISGCCLYFCTRTYIFDILRRTFYLMLHGQVVCTRQAVVGPKRARFFGVQGYEPSAEDLENLNRTLSQSQTQWVGVHREY